MENNTLVIERVKKDDEGHYECKAVNEMGQDSTRAFIRIEGELAKGGGAQPSICKIQATQDSIETKEDPGGT